MAFSVHPHGEDATPDLVIGHRAFDSHSRLAHASAYQASLRIALYEESKPDREALERLLIADGHEVHTRSSAEDFVPLIRQDIFDLLIMAWDEHDAKGLELVRQVRSGGYACASTSILILTSRLDEFDVVRGLESGADGYLPKPWRPFELLARIKALMRIHRVARGEAEAVLHGFTFDAAGHRVQGYGLSVVLAPKEFALALHFFLHLGEVVTREYLLSNFWDESSASRTLDQHIGRIRCKLLNPSQRFVLQSVYGVGYVLRRFSSTARAADANGASPTEPVE